jgi:hypothetical protein
MTYVDAVARISQIEQQISQLSGASAVASATAAGTANSTTATGTAAGSATPASFADALAQAQGTSSVLTGGVGLAGTGATTLPSAATTMLSTGQQQFATQLSADTGLDPGVVSAWLLAEESGSAAQSRQAAGNNDWLNIGYTDSGTYGSADSAWADPVTAANATAGWLKGQNTIPGYGTASSGIQAILSAAGQSPAAQMSALQSSGWASGGYPDLPSLYTQVTA